MLARDTCGEHVLVERNDEITAWRSRVWWCYHFFCLLQRRNGRNRAQQLLRRNAVCTVVHTWQGNEILKTAASHRKLERYDVFQRLRSLMRRICISYHANGCGKFSFGF
ncbi:hypothetical protein TRVL_08510 [Trypanosoma vivax]|nr:hypothetical protein TRVL_08510 [Trypanosoma vivax]